MQIQLNTDRNIENHAGLFNHVQDMVRKTLEPFKDNITRVEVHLTDVNAKKASERDKRCVMEFRLNGHQPIAVTAEADTVHRAIDSAVKKMRNAAMVEHDKQISRRHD